MIFKTREEALKALKVLAVSVVNGYAQATEIAIEHGINTAVFEKFIRDATNEVMLNKIREKVDEIRNGAKAVNDIRKEIDGIDTYDDFEEEE